MGYINVHKKEKKKKNMVNRIMNIQHAQWHCAHRNINTKHAL